jgi:protein O-GlcNAc transferase
MDMNNAGLDLARVTLVGLQSLDDYFRAHNEVDFLLDTFPFPGGTTTAFALYMGVPTVTLSGETMIARQGTSMMNCVGLVDWIAQSESEYLDICVRMAASRATLDSLRSTLRQRAMASPLFDNARFAADFGAALQAMHVQAASADK